MSSLNRVMLIGNIGKDPEIRNTKSGGKIANLTIATSERWKDKSGEQKERTEWHRVVIFNENLVRVVENYAKKGSKIYIEGQLQTRKWTDQSGQDKYSTEVVLQAFNGQIVLLDKKENAEPRQAASHSAPAQEVITDIDDEIPW